MTPPSTVPPGRLVRVCWPGPGPLILVFRSWPLATFAAFWVCPAGLDAPFWWSLRPSSVLGTCVRNQPTWRCEDVIRPAFWREGASRGPGFRVGALLWGMELGCALSAARASVACSHPAMGVSTAHVARNLITRTYKTPGLGRPRVRAVCLWLLGMLRS